MNRYQTKRIKAGIPLIVCLLVSCGIEDYVYLNPVDNIYATGSTSARITIPGNSGEFRYYAIFYRIYISDVNIESIGTSAQRYEINRELASHYNAIYPYTTNDNVTPSSVGTIFTTYKYHPLYVEYTDSGGGMQNAPMSRLLSGQASSLPQPAGHSINDISQNAVIDIVFAQAGPYMKITYSGSDTGDMLLRRTAEGGTMFPDRSFFNTPDLTNAGNIGSGKNEDVQNNSSMTTMSRYTYVSMYIAASGIDNNLTSVYSSPKHIGIFRLPTP